MHQKITDLYFFLIWIISPFGVMPLLKIIMKFCNQDISKTITARSFKLGQLIEDNK